MNTLTDLFGLDSQSWMAEGFCADTLTPDLWFPSDRYESAALAEELCGGCPARVDCFRYAMTNSEVEGIWAGTTTTERRRLRSELACGTPKGYARHRARNEDACTECKAAQAASRREQYAKKKAEYYPQHGTPAGYSWHRRHDIPACDPCLRAQGEKSKAKRAAVKKAAAA